MLHILSLLHIVTGFQKVAPKVSFHEKNAFFFISNFQVQRDSPSAS